MSFPHFPQILIHNEDKSIPHICGNCELIKKKALLNTKNKHFIDKISKNLL